MQRQEGRTEEVRDIYPQGEREWRKEGHKERLYVDGQPTAYVRIVG